MPNNRIFYASHAVAVNSTQNTPRTVQGAQSVSVDTNFNLEQVFQLGRLDIYDNIQVDPDVSITINKVLDGHELIWTLSQANHAGPVPADGSIITHANDTSTIDLTVGEDTRNVLAAANATSFINMTGCFVDSLTYTFPVDGDFTEEVTFVGSHKAHTSAIDAPIHEGPGLVTADTGGNVLRRQNMQLSQSTLPSEVTGRKISNITVSTSFGREKMFTLGQFSPFHRFVNFPIEITTTFDVIADDISDSGDALIEEVTNECEGRGEQRKPIFLAVCDAEGNTAYEFDLGTGNALQSISYSGGDTGGGNVTETFTYIGYNTLTINDFTD
jgi:hypothetical protein